MTIIPSLSMEPTIQPESDVWLVTGIPGAGKSTVARMLASTFPRGAHIEGDRLQEWVASGAVWPHEEPPAEANRQISLNRRNQCLLARSFADAGFVPVIDYVVVSRALIADYMRLLEGLRLRLVVLAPGAETALQRDRDRAEKTVAHLWVHLEEELNRELESIGLWIDSRHQTPDETVAEIRTRAAKAAVTPDAIG